MNGPRAILVVLLDGDLVQAPEHLGVAYLLGSLRRAGYEGSIIEVAVGEDDAALARIVAEAPLFAGLTLTTVSVPRATAFGAKLRALAGERLHITAGGPLATFLSERLLQNPAWRFLDSLVRGEGELPVVALATALASGHPLDTVPSLAFRRGGGVIVNPIAAGIANLDDLPWPERDQILGAKTRPPYVRISTSRGCTSQCTFCNAPHAGNNISGSKVWRGRSPENVVDEIEHLASVHRFSTFDFIDSTFEDPGGTVAAKARIGRIAELILERGLSIYFNCCMQAQNWSDADEPLVSLLAESGLEKVLVGLESGSDAGLRRWRKRATTADNERVLAVLRRHGIYVAFGYIMFHPNVTAEEVAESARFLRRFLGHNLRRFTTRLELYPGAQEVETLRAEGLLDPNYDSTLNPFAYSFRDAEMGALARCMALLAGDEYAMRGTLSEEPAHFAFETYDITLHTFSSRLRRRQGSSAAASELLDEFDGEVAQTKDEMAAYNFALFFEAWEALRRDGGLSAERVAGFRTDVQQRFKEWMRRLSGLQLKLGMALRRRGLGVRPEQLGSRLTA